MTYFNGNVEVKIKQMIGRAGRLFTIIWRSNGHMQFYTFMIRTLGFRSRAGKLFKKKGKKETYKLAKKSHQPSIYLIENENERVKSSKTVLTFM